MGPVQQLGFDGMPRRLFACTPTRLGTWLDCPRRYRMTYLDRPPPGKGPAWAHNSLGASVHNALAGWWRLPREERTVAGAGRLLERGWIVEGFADSAQSARYLRWARSLVEAYVAGLDPSSEPLGVERTVATRTDLIAVSGRIDRLDDRRGPDGVGELVVVDYKTGRHVLTVDDARTSLPLALYALAAERVMRRPCRRVELHHLPTGRVLAWEHTAESLDRHLRRAEDIAAECAAADEQFRGPRDGPGRDGRGRGPGDGPTLGLPESRVDEVFPPRVGTWCGWCDYRASCPEGSAASEPRRPWDGLAAEGEAGQREDDQPGAARSGMAAAGAAVAGVAQAGAVAAGVAQADAAAAGTAQAGAGRAGHGRGTVTQAEAFAPVAEPGAAAGQARSD
jgi:RecB family exonuclease